MLAWLVFYSIVIFGRFHYSSFFPFRPRKGLLRSQQRARVFTMARKQRSIVLLLLAAFVAGVALVAFLPATVFARSLKDSWEDELRPRAGEHNNDDNDYKLIEINYPCEQLARFSVDQFNERRLGPRVSFLSFGFGR